MGGGDDTCTDEREGRLQGLFCLSKHPSIGQAFFARWPRAGTCRLAFPVLRRVVPYGPLFEFPTRSAPSPSQDDVPEVWTVAATVAEPDAGQWDTIRISGLQGRPGCHSIAWHPFCGGPPNLREPMPFICFLWYQQNDEGKQGLAPKHPSDPSFAVEFCRRACDVRLSGFRFSKRNGTERL